MNKQENIFYCEQFPLANKYDPKWIIENQMGPNPIWLTDFLTQAFDLKPGMRVLDLGCGKGLTSVFLAREFGVQVYAVDLWDSPDGKWQLAKEQGVGNLIIPIQADARNLPFAEGFFDAIISIDSYFYFGTDDLYLKYITKYLRSGGKIGMVVPGVMKDLVSGVPEHLTSFWEEDCWGWHTPKWWENHWGKIGIVDIDIADVLDNSCELWIRWNEAIGFSDDTEALTNDNNEYLGFIRLVATKK